MSLQAILQLISPMIVIITVIGGAALTLWKKFDKRMNKGDDTLLTRLEMMEASRKHERMADQAVVQEVVSDLTAVKLEQAEARGVTKTLIALYGSRPPPVPVVPPPAS